MSRRKKRNKQDSGDKAEIDLTPMLDVVFIMLIFFIVTASFVKESTVNVNVPEDSNAPPPPPSNDNKSILVLVDDQNDVFIDGRRVDVRSVRSLIAQKNAANPGSSLVIRAHENANTETYMKIADASRDANVYAISLVPFSN